MTAAIFLKDDVTLLARLIMFYAILLLLTISCFSLTVPVSMDVSFGTWHVTMWLIFVLLGGRVRNFITILSTYQCTHTNGQTQTNVQNKKHDTMNKSCRE